MYVYVIACINTIPSVYLPILILGFDGINLMKEKPVIAMVILILSIISMDVVTSSNHKCDNIGKLIVSCCGSALNNSVFWSDKNKKFWIFACVVTIVIGICHIIGYIVLVNFFGYDGQFWVNDTYLVGFVTGLCVCIIIFCIIKIIALILTCRRTRSVNCHTLGSVEPLNEYNNEYDNGYVEHNEYNESYSTLEIDETLRTIDV